MKKLLAIVLAALLLLGMIPFAGADGARAELQTAKPIGDINGDGTINAKDVTTLRRYLAGGYGITVDSRSADVNGDGTLSAKDITILRRYLAGGYGIELGTYDDVPALTYNGVVTGGQLYTDLGAPTFGADAYTLTVIADGVEQSADYCAAIAAKIVDGGTDAVTVAGSYTEVEKNDTAKTVTMTTSILFLDPVEEYESTTLDFTDGSKYRLLGRAEQAADGVVCNGCADGLEFKADCRGSIALTASVSSIETYNVTFRVLVDGVASNQFSFSAVGEKTATLVTDVAPGVHTIRVLKDYELSESRDLLKSVTLICKPSTVQPTAQKDKFFVIIGDSDVSGFGVIPTSTPTSTKNSSSAVLSFGYLAAEQLGVDYEIMSRRSMGVLKTVGTPKYNYQGMFEYQNRWRDGTKLYDFARQADVVMVKVSGNDKSFTAEEETAAMNTFIATIRSHYGASVPIIIFYTQSTTHKPVAEALVAGDPLLYGVTVTYDKTGMGDHSTAESHVYYADEVVKVAQPLLSN